MKKARTTDPKTEEKEAKRESRLWNDLRAAEGWWKRGEDENP